MYEICGEAVLIPGRDGAYTRRSVSDLHVYCGGYCWTCGNYSNNPGCKIKEYLRTLFESISPKYWNILLKEGLID